MNKIRLYALLLISLLSCRTLEKKDYEENSLFLPPPGYRYMFISTGPDELYSYIDSVGLPAGITIYTGIKDFNDISGENIEDSTGMKGRQSLDDPALKNVMLALVLDLKGELTLVNSGGYDREIRQMGEWITNSGRPVFLIIGHGLNEPLNRGLPDQYKRAFIRITGILKSEEVSNFVTVWQPSGEIEETTDVMPWYPGDDYVDWMGYSYFDKETDQAGKAILTLAGEKEKPVFISASAPRGYDLGLDDPEEIWENWFEPFFRHIEDNTELINAVSYTSVFRAEGENEQVREDTRIQAHPLIRKKWLREVSQPGWINRSAITEESGGGRGNESEGKFDVEPGKETDNESSEKQKKGE